MLKNYLIDNILRYLTLLSHFLAPTLAPISDPCTPNPCGANSICRAQGTVAHCSCRPALMAEPPACRAECRTDAECAPQLACRSGKCRDPCPGACGARALCRTVMHSPICTCPINYVGDPFVRCLPGESKIQHRYFF